LIWDLHNKMAHKDKKQNNVGSNSPVPSDAELFAGDVQNDYSAQDIFAGDDSLYRALAQATEKSVEAPEVQAPTAPKSQKDMRLNLKKAQLPQLTTPRFSLLQKVLLGAISFVVIILSLAIFKTPKNSYADANLTPPIDINSQLPPALEVNEQTENQIELAYNLANAQTPPNTKTPVHEELPLDSPLSLKIAQDMFEAGQYQRAYLVYHQIQQYLPLDNVETAFYDYLTLQKGLCLIMNQDSVKARRSLALATKSQTPGIRVMANYYLSTLELSQNQFMAARSRACEALALLDGLPVQSPEWLSKLKQTCCYLVAQATSKQALILRNADKELPSNLCPALPMITSPWYKFDETQVRDTLAKGSGLLASILLAPSISSDPKMPQTPWSVSCHRMALDELLARFGATIDLEVVWHDEANFSEHRKKAISLYIKDVTDQTVISLAAGSAGLLAQIGDDRMIHVMNPVNAALVSEQIAMLAQEATTMWQRYLFSSTESPNFAYAHFISGLLYKQMSLKAEALSEFKLVAARYSRSNLAPYALLYSSQVNEELKNSGGVEKDLKLLVEQYPDVPIITEAYIRLANVIAQAGDNKEAAKLYRKVFYLKLSEESRVTSALNAGRCFYETQDYASAELWLTQYIQMVQGSNPSNNKEIYPAFFILGKSLLAQGKPKMACQALRNALKGVLDKEDYLDAMGSLVQGYMKQQDLMEAIDVLEDAFNPQLTPSDILELNLLKSAALRHAGLMDRAIKLLQNNKNSVSDPYLNAKLSFELSLNLIEKGELAQAQKELSLTLTKVESGQLAHQVALALAQVCLDLKQEDQAVSVCQSLLQLESDPLLSHKAAELLAKAYTNQQNYDKAAQALIEQWN